MGGLYPVTPPRRLLLAFINLQLAGWECPEPAVSPGSQVYQAFASIPLALPQVREEFTLKISDFAALMFALIYVKQ